MMNLPKHSGGNGVPLLKIQQATVIKNDTRLLDGITLEIREGQHTAILGPNGAGKSALIRLITQQDYALAHDDGTPPLLIFGQQLWNVFELRALLGIVSGDLQDSYLQRTMPGRTRGLDVVLSGFFASYGVFWHHHITPQMREQALQALTWLEASSLADKFIEQMSAGEVRRILIARSWCLIPGD
jgi:iron complex transport system ATP-binding protein